VHCAGKSIKWRGRMNFKGMTYKEITQLVSSLDLKKDIEEAISLLDNLIESLKILRGMLDGRKTLQMQKDKMERRRGLKVVTKRNKRRP
jgi:argininosuccinate lyase